MSPLEALGSFPVVHHFYPIDPATFCQQSSPVLNPPSAPLVEPIRPSAIPQPREPKRKLFKMKLDQEEIEIEELILESPPSRPKRAKKDCVQLREKMGVLVPIRLAPQRQRSRVYVEVPIPKSFDRSLYNPISLSSSIVECGQTSGHGQRAPSISPIASLPWSPSTTPSLSVTSNGFHDPDSDYVIGAGKVKKVHVRTTQRNSQEHKIPKELETACAERPGYEDDATTCHQCRRKNMSNKMRCRNIRENGLVCPFSFCQSCIRVRYDEEFDCFNRTWHCPRCRGMCNCSMCLRKAGIGYILDIAGGQLSRGAKLPGKDSDQISVRRWLARRGLALGTDEWMDEQRRQGVRYVVGKSPPPRDKPSPYKSAQFIPRLTTCEDRQHEVNEIGSPLDPILKGDGGIASTMDTSLCVDESVEAGLSLNTREVSPEDPPTGIPFVPAYSTTFYPQSPSTLTSLSEGCSPPEVPRVSSLKSYAATEDLPGLTPLQTRRLHLIVGGRLTERKRCVVPNFRTARLWKARNSKRHVESNNDLNYTPAAKKRLKILLPPIHVRQQRSIPSLDEDNDTEYKDEHPEGESPSGSGHAPLFVTDNAPATPPLPPPEPVFVPNEDYTPRKLDLTHVQDPEARLAESFWSLDMSRAQEHLTESLPQSEKVLYSYLPPYDNNYIDSNSQPQPSHTTTTFTHRSSSMSTSRTQNDFLGPMTRDTGFAPSGLSPLAALGETWTAGTGVGMDVPILQIEHLVDPRLSLPGDVE